MHDRLRPGLIDLARQNILDDSRKVANQLVEQFKMTWYDLYNTLKWIRNTMNVSTLNLNKHNVVDIIGKFMKMIT